MCAVITKDFAKQDAIKAMLVQHKLSAVCKHLPTVKKKNIKKIKRAKNRIDKIEIETFLGAYY